MKKTADIYIYMVGFKYIYKFLRSKVNQAWEVLKCRDDQCPHKSNLHKSNHFIHEQ